jgi:hypothetical protein
MERWSQAGKPSALRPTRLGTKPMFRKLLGVLGVGLALAGMPASAQSYEPYPNEPAANEIYDLLFCDHLSDVQPRPGEKPANWKVLLFGPTPDPARVAELAQDASNESRVRAFAFNWLRAHGRPTPKGVVLGVIVEVPLDQGLDVLAAYADGSVRYINQSGKMAFIEPGGMPGVSRQAKQLVELAQSVVGIIGPWDKARLPPPAQPNIRLTFLVSDGLYFGEGPMQTMQRDPMAGPLLQQETQLLQLVVENALTKPAP